MLTYRLFRYHIIMKILILFLIMSLRMVKELGPTNQNINKGYCKSNDSMNTILSRIKYCSHYNGRINTIERYLFYSLILNITIFLLLFNKIKINRKFVKCIFVTWIILILLGSYFSHHADKFKDYCIERNVNLLRRRLKIKRLICDDKLSIQKKKYKGYERPFTFFY